MVHRVVRSSPRWSASVRRVHCALAIGSCSEPVGAGVGAASQPCARTCDIPRRRRPCDRRSRCRAGRSTDVTGDSGSTRSRLGLSRVRRGRGSSVTATLGGARSDVAGFYGAQFGSSGFNLLVTAAMPLGDYRLAVFARRTSTQEFGPAFLIAVTVRGVMLSDLTCTAGQVPPGMVRCGNASRPELGPWDPRGRWDRRRNRRHRPPGAIGAVGPSGPQG